MALNEITTSDASVGVLAAGVIPYYTGLRATDFLGRTDKYIASLPADLSGAVGWNGMYSVPGHNKYDLAYSIQTVGADLHRGEPLGRARPHRMGLSTLCAREVQGCRAVASARLSGCKVATTPGGLAAGRNRNITTAREFQDR